MKWLSFLIDEKSTWPGVGDNVLVKTASGDTHLARFSVDIFNTPFFRIQVRKEDATPYGSDQYGLYIDGKMTRAWAILE